MRLKWTIGVLVGALLSFSAYANTTTTLTITKTTLLTGQDAAKFMKTFGNDFNGQQSPLHFRCDVNNGCTIVATKAGFSGTLAKQLLNGRKSAIFSSTDHHFILECGSTPVNYCNVIQHDAILP